MTKNRVNSELKKGPKDAYETAYNIEKQTLGMAPRVVPYTADDAATTRWAHRG